jgi:hypothetical protein
MSLIDPGHARARERLTEVVVCLMLLCSSSSMRAQNNFRRLTGTVTDASHEPLSGAVVELHDDDTDSIVSYITNRSGRYTFPRFSGQDNYHVRAKFRSQESRSRSLSKFDAKPNRNINLVIKLE